MNCKDKQNVRDAFEEVFKALSGVLLVEAMLGRKVKILKWEDEK